MEMHLPVEQAAVEMEAGLRTQLLFFLMNPVFQKVWCSYAGTGNSRIVSFGEKSVCQENKVELYPWESS